LLFYDTEEATSYSLFFCSLGKIMDMFEDNFEDKMKRRVKNVLYES
jgi:hypothetical protein